MQTDSNIVRETNEVAPGSDEFEPLRICLLGYRSKPYCGGQGVYIRYLSSALAKMGHTVDVISGEPYPELKDNVRLIKMPGLNLYEKENRLTAIRPKDFRSITNLFEWFSVLTGGFPEPFTFGRRIVEYFEKNKYQYDLIHDNQSLCYGLLKLQRRNIPVVATIHHPITKDREIALGSSSGLRHRLLIRRWHSFLRMQRQVVRKLNHLLTVSDRSRHDIAEAFDISKSKISLVYNGIDTEEFAPMPDVERLPGRIMATASADVPLKGLDFLLQALASLIPRYPDLDLLVVGSPKPGGHTEGLINSLGIAGKVTFVNNLTTEDIRRLYAQASMAVVPSLYEGFGLPAGEAMSCSVPIVSTTGGALPEVVGDAGVLVPTGDAIALADAIADLMDHPEKREKYGVAGRKRILEKFSWEVAAKQMTRYYYKLLKNVDN
ncbi:MAG: glycosyltransferase family 4 protein [Proteobacteria bacterium]|nr:glycosyltransferase family 4 protein [Pseudomonadota bacterium]